MVVVVVVVVVAALRRREVVVEALGAGRGAREAREAWDRATVAVARRAAAMAAVPREGFSAERRSNDSRRGRRSRGRGRAQWCEMRRLVRQRSAARRACAF